MSTFIAYKVTDLCRETADIVSLYLSPSDNSPLEHYFPGQYITVRLGDRLRNYTLSDAPGAPYYRITVKRETHGQVSSLLHQLKTGDQLLALKTPEGDFHWSPANRKALVLLSAGVGITPMVSILNHLRKQNYHKPVWLVHSARTGNDVALRRDLDQARSDMENLNVMLHFTRGQAFDPDARSASRRITMDLLKRILPGSGAEYFLCGPPSFISYFYKALLANGIPSPDVHYELFSVRNTGSAGSEGPSRDHIVHFSTSEKQIMWHDRFASLLELAEAGGISIPSSCRSGTCLTCETRLYKGTVRYTSELFVEPRPDHILPCSAVPSSDLIIGI